MNVVAYWYYTNYKLLIAFAFHKLLIILSTNTYTQATLWALELDTLCSYFTGRRPYFVIENNLNTGFMMVTVTVIMTMTVSKLPERCVVSQQNAG
jgi:hypothetical protein